MKIPRTIFKSTDLSTFPPRDYEVRWCKSDDVEPLEESHAEILSALQDLLAIVENSRGVLGYHLNGDVAEWGEFHEVEQAFAAVSKAKGMDDEPTDTEGNIHG